MRNLSLAPWLLVTASFVNVATAQTLVKDFNTTPVTTEQSSNAAVVMSLNSGAALLVATTPGLGGELWITDGTVNGTRLLADITPGLVGSSPQQFVKLPSGLVLFTASTPQHGWELWRTDGTSAGTVLVRDIRPGTVGSVAVHLTVVGNEVVFLADDGVHGIEPWKSDGTAQGTVLIADTNPIGSMSNGTAELAALGTTQFVFTAANQSFTQWQLWKSDGTAQGTVRITDLPGSLNFRPSHLTPLGNRVLFVARTAANTDDVWSSDGTAAGTMPLSGFGSSDFQVAGNVAYFAGGANDIEPWCTDGTIAGTYQVIDLAPGSGFNGWSRPSFLGAIGNRVVFTASSGGFGRDLYVSDGTAAGTTQIGPCETYAYYSANWASPIGAELYFEATNNGATGIWRTDGTAAGTALIAPISGGGFKLVNNTILFRGVDPSAGSELFVTDGTTAGTRLFLDLYQVARNADSNASILASFRDELVLMADDQVSGNELWLTDGTPNGTRRITDIGAGAAGAYFQGVTSTDTFLFIRADTGVAPNDPWVSDGSLAGTRRLLMSPQYPGFYTTQSAALRGQVVFGGATTAEGVELWITDGSTAGTRPLVNINAGPMGSNPSYFYTWKEKTFFLASTPATGGEPWVTDGTAAGTFQLTNATPGTNGWYSLYFAEAGDRLYFIPGGGSESEPWVTDGTSAGTFKLDIAPGNDSSSPTNFIDVNGLTMFSAVISTTRRLFVSDGTIAGTQMLPQPQNILLVARIDADTALVVSDDPTGRTAWTSDGTAAGTQVLGPMPIFSTYSVNASNLSDDKLVLELNDPIVGRELFITDGTVAGTQLLFDLAPEHSRPGPRHRAGKRIVFTADDGIHGMELFSFDQTLLRDETIDTLGFGCAGFGGLVPQISIVGEPNATSPVPFDIAVDQALAFTPVLIAASTEAAAIPIDECFLWTGGNNVVFVTGATDGLGRARFSIQPTPALMGQRFLVQALALDPLGQIFGALSSTAALEVIIGP